jgi:DNA-binding NarL/FixJ family response regulator
VSEGLTNREIASSLILSTKTVEAHLSRAFSKLGVTSRTQLARIIIESAPNGQPARLLAPANVETDPK